MTSRLDFAAIRARHPLAEVVRTTTKLRRSGSKWICCCPFHDDQRPSLSIFGDGQRFCCFGCGAKGDVFDYLQRFHNVSILEAVEMLESGSLPAWETPKIHIRSNRNNAVATAAILRATRPIAGTPAEVYLRRRGLHLPLPHDLRYTQTRNIEANGNLPCLVAPVTNSGNEVAAIQRTYVRDDGSGKADVPTPKKSLGRIRGGAIRLASASEEMIVTGGLEDALTLLQEYRLPVWAAAGEGNMANMFLPTWVKSIIIGADGDGSGERYAQQAAHTFRDQGRKVRIIRPRPGFKDFNDQLMGVGS